MDGNANRHDEMREGIGLMIGRISTAMGVSIPHDWPKWASAIEDEVITLVELRIRWLLASREAIGRGQSPGGPPRMVAGDALSLTRECLQARLAEYCRELDIVLPKEVAKDIAAIDSAAFAGVDLQLLGRLNQAVMMCGTTEEACEAVGRIQLAMLKLANIGKPRSAKAGEVRRDGAANAA